ncbi:MAG: thiamine-phosphate kinase [Pseudonocardiaceae bacterium]
MGAKSCHDEHSKYLTEIGEYQAHALLEQLLNVGGRRNIGDDCAIYELDGDHVLLVNVDRLASNVEEYNRARLCVTQTLSDIICMGGTPDSFLVALTLPRDTEIESLRVLTQALQNELASYGAHLIGGDTKEGTSFHMVGVGLGRARAKSLVRRVGAAPGMLIGVTSTQGRLWGMRWANAVIRELGLAVPADVASLCEQSDHVIHLPYSESRAVIATGYIRAGLDLSDGVGGGLRILTRASNVGVSISAASLANLVDPRLGLVADALDLPLECFALSPGYNWENMYVVEDAGVEAVIEAARSVGGQFSVIGRITSDLTIRIDGAEVDEKRLSADEKFAKSHAWENRFTAWQENCHEVLRSVH